MDKTKRITSIIFLLFSFSIVLVHAEQPIQKKPLLKPQLPIKEECCSFSPPATLVVNKGGNWAVVDTTQPDLIIASFPADQKVDADRALDIIQRYGMNQICFIKPGFQYGLISGQSFIGRTYPGEVCRDFDSNKVAVANIQGRWRVVEGSNVIFDFGTNELQAKMVLGTIKKHGFTRSCSVGRPPGFHYMAKPSITQTAKPSLPPSPVTLSLTQFFPDLKLELDTAPTPASDRETELAVLVVNIGKAPVRESFVTELYVDGKLTKQWLFPSEGERRELAKDGKIPQFAPGGNRRYTYYARSHAGEKHTFRWIADARKQILEKDESQTSNQLEIALTWPFPDEMPDLIVEDIYTDKPLVMGEDATIKVRIKNNGPMDARGSFMTSFKIGSTQVGAFWLDYLKGYGSETFESKPMHIRGQTVFRAEVDVGNVIPEKDENNIMQKQLTPLHVDLAVSNLSILPRDPVTNEPVTISFNLSNPGTADAIKPFQVLVDPGRVTNGLVQPALLSIPSLKAGAQMTLQHNVSLPYPGDYRLMIQADYPSPNSVYIKNEKKRDNNQLPPGKLTVSKDDDRDGINDDVEQELAEKWAPIVIHSIDESNFPTNVDTFLRYTSLWLYDDTCEPDKHLFFKNSPTQRDLIERNKTGGCDTYVAVYSNATVSLHKNFTFYLKDLPKQFQKGSQDSSEWTTYYHAYPNFHGGITIQYWRFYAYNDAANNHGGDWEGIHFVLDADLKPLKIGFLGHTSMDYRSTNDAGMRWEGYHPVVYSEGGGHATRHTWKGALPGLGIKGLDGNDPRTYIKQETWTNGKVYWNDGRVTKSGALLNVGSKTRPMNGQEFIQYSGIWGSPGDHFGTSGYWGPAYNETGRKEHELEVKAWCAEALQPAKWTDEEMRNECWIQSYHDSCIHDR